MRGWPGVGKSTFAAALANDPEVVQAFPDGILWVSLGEEPNVVSEVANLGSVLGTACILSIDSIGRASGELNRLLQDQTVLLIVDDVWRVEDGAFFRIGGDQTRVVFTTRLPPVAQSLAVRPDRNYLLSPLDEGSSLMILEQTAPDVLRKHPQSCVELVKELQGLPLALRVAGGMLASEAHYGWEVESLVEELRKDAGRILDHDAPSDMIDIAEESTPTVAALFRKSTDRLNDEERTCFARLGVFASKPATFSVSAMARVWEVEDPKPMIRRLVDCGLLEPAGQSRFQVHALLMKHAELLLSR